MSGWPSGSKKRIASGTLPTGTKLPPQRDLAFDIGVTIGTVGRAYALGSRARPGQRRGRPRHLRARPRARSADCTRQPHRGIPAGTRAPVHARQAAHGQHVGAGGRSRRGDRKADAAEILRSHPDEVVDYTRVWPASWQEAGSRWLRSGNWTPDPDSDRLDDRRACRSARRHRRDDRARRQDRLSRS